MIRRTERGAALVEIAIFLPLLVFLLAAATSVASIVTGYAKLTDASHAAARYATRAAIDPARTGTARYRPTADEVEAYVRSIAGVPIDSVSVTPDPSVARPGTPITVVVVARVSSGPLGAVAGHDDVTFTSTTVMREE
jgi:Flp pilus assembly protein TadG